MKHPLHGTPLVASVLLAASTASCVISAPKTSLHGDNNNPAKGLVVLDGSAPGWRASLVLDNDPTGIWRMEPLQLLPQYATPEIVGLDDNGTCWVMVSYSGKWTPLPVLHDGTWLGGLAFGDVDPQAAGNELYVGGKKGVLYQVRSYHDGGLDGRRIAYFPGREIHTLVAGDVDPTHDGAELLVFTRPGAMFRVYRDAEGKFQSEALGDLPSRIRDAILLPDGHTIATASRDGRIALLTMNAKGPSWETIQKIDEGCGRLAIGKLAARGFPILYSTGDNGRVFRHEPLADGGWKTTTIYSGPLGPRGLVAGQFSTDPKVESVVVFGYSGRVELLERHSNSWTTTTLFTDRDRGHWLSALEIDGRNNTEEILLSGYGARITLLSRNPGSGIANLSVPVALDRHAQR